MACDYYGGSTDAEVFEIVKAIGQRLTQIFAESDKTGQPTNVIADAQARKIIDDGRS